MSQINLDYNVPIWKINGLEFEFDTEDPSTWVRYENAYKSSRNYSMMCLATMQEHKSLKVSQTTDATIMQSTMTL